MQTPSIGSIESSVGCRSIYCRFSGQEIPVPLIEGVFRVSVLWTSHRMRPCIAILSVLAILASTGSIGSMFRSRGRYRMKIVIVTCGTCTWEIWIIVCYMRREKSVFSRNYLRTLRGRQHLFKKKKNWNTPAVSSTGWLINMYSTGSVMHRPRVWMHTFMHDLTHAQRQKASTHT